MRKLIKSIILAGTAILMLMPVPPVQSVRPVQATEASAADPDITFEIHYTVRYACNVSPYFYGVIVGEWIRDCEGNMTGWGMEPGENCTTTEITAFYECY